MQQLPQFPHAHSPAPSQFPRVSYAVMTKVQTSERLESGGRGLGLPPP